MSTRGRLVSAKELAAEAQGPPRVAEGFVPKDQTAMDKWMMEFNTVCTGELERQLAQERGANYTRKTTFGFLDIAPFVRNGIEAIYQDSFTQCFESKPRRAWKTSFYLFPLYYCGVAIRYFVLFPVRLTIVLFGLLLFTLMFGLAAMLGSSARLWLQGQAIHVLANSFLWAFCAVITEHGVMPPRTPGQIYVANHSTVVDVVLLLKSQKFALTGQEHPGVLGFFQNYVLASLDCLWFDRLAGKDRHLVAEKIKEHCRDTNKPPLLVFPEGTCVNNEYVIMFKRGAFELGTSIVPVAIKYNKVFVDAFWNSKQQSFVQHLFTIMTSWALVADVWYMDPQVRRSDESSTAFAERVKDLIAKQANLISVPWDGYLKYFKPKKEMLEERRRMYARMLLQRFSGAAPVVTSATLDPEAIKQIEAKAARAMKEASKPAKPTGLRARRISASLT